jgi:hypothetical protein
MHLLASSVSITMSDEGDTNTERKTKQEAQLSPYFDK